ncbi:LacI family DNA-binding transcriptional regulator [Dyadobacter fanqingshengii]|uniref:Substrate-binding domain-containing protein n=1 Tax=Dyadobacter fanqingshengii TaxID=2906443 RepID=A0A9X1PC75_9BACT|nr:substrate-binding domain-containing protein [Dyadobacter fanqingshengii]MCF0040587.1 substrate-binding domain-containing protein [Dyadobacter fanqingshengii]USJ37675.1 substrate-binding domain-containing protein [Dyadobacter fanqingshengii]
MEKENTLFGVKEIARRANVSTATVDRVLHNRTGVSEKTKKRINDIIKELDYQPNILASRLASKKIITLAILIPEVSEETDFWEAPLNGVRKAEAEIKQYGIQTLIFFFDLNNKDSYVQKAREILELDVHGILIAPSFVTETQEFAKECNQRKIPFVFIDSDIPELKSLSYIGPHLYKSGYVGAKLLTYRLQPDKKVLIINISKEIDNFNYEAIEEGFRAYFSDNQNPNEIVRIDIHETDYQSVARHLTYVFHLNKDIGAAFVTNSRVNTVASFLKNSHRTEVSLIGYDFVKDNVKYLENNVIDFLICHRPEDQAYRGIMALYQTLVMNSSVSKLSYMPIDIVTKENYEFYQN